MRKMTVKEFLATPNVYPLVEGEPCLCINGIVRGIPPDVEIIVDELFKGVCGLNPETQGN